MTDATWSLGGTFGTHNPKHVKHGGLQRATAMRLLGAVVYAARLADGTIKIGFTERFDARLHHLKHYVKQDVELLAFRVGTFDEEQEIHASLVDHRADMPDHDMAREFYRPTPEVLAVINDMRSGLKMPPIAA